MEDQQQMQVTEEEEEIKSNQVEETPAEPDKTAQADTTEETEEEKKSSKQITAEEPEDFSHEKYACDRQYAVTLAQLMASKDREKVYRWVERLNIFPCSQQGLVPIMVFMRFRL